MPIIAHRGYSARAPENTAEAMRLALEAGASGLEWDIQETACHTPVVFHDYTLERTTTGRGRVRETPLEEFCSLDSGRWFSPEYEGVRPVTLESLLSELAASSAHFYAEIKAGLSASAVEEVARLIQVHGVEARTTVMSFDWWALALLRQKLPEQKVAILVDTEDEFEGALLRAQEVGNAIVDCNYRTLLTDPKRVRRAQELGIDLAVYTVNEVGVARALQSLGVEGITTNEVSALLKGLKGK